MRRLLIYIILSYSLLTLKGAAADVDSLLKVLDRAVASRSESRRAKEAKIQQVRGKIYEAKDDSTKFEELGRLFDEYRSYDTDSAMAISERRIALAQRMGSETLVKHANLNLANVLLIMGMYKESSEILSPLNGSDIPEYLIPYFYFLKRTLYSQMADYAIRSEDKIRYTSVADNYRDSTLMVQEPGSIYEKVICGNILNSRGEYLKTVQLLENYLNTHDIDEHEQAIAAFTLAESYHLLNEPENEKRQLIISAINDMRSGIREYVSLRELALMLYREGDVKHAYDYLRICMDDAKQCNARLRMLEVNDIFPVVNEVYLDTIKRQQTRLRWSLLLVGVLACLLLATVYLVYNQMKKVRKARRNVAEINGKLRQANQSLTRANEQLNLANRSIAENSNLKEEYIARYMDQCIIYIEKLDKYRISLNKILKSGKTDDLKAFINTQSKLDVEIKAFYDNFDETFLRLFPSFIEDFNKLLVPEERIYPKTAGRLNTELRIFALIRLGINDSARIAQFLRYSLTTIYNYRTRVRNKAAGDRDNLEEELMHIGRMY